MKGIFSKIMGKGKKKDVITIVSGLPRSGTSLMMRMLEAGGVPVVSDGIRKADEDNPRGYYEFEKVKKIKEDTSWLEGCRNKAFKMVSELLYNLPADKNYKVIFMRRNMEEMLASQRVMLERLGNAGANVGDKKMTEFYEKSLQKVEHWLARQDNIDVLYVNYNEVVNCPDKYARMVSQFLGSRLDVDKMSGVVEKALYRQRK